MIYIILIFQAVTTYLDNKSNMFDFFQQTSKGKVASAFTDRGKILFISRNTFFVVPPLLGYLILNLSIDTFRNLILIVLFMNFLMTLLHAIMYFRVLKITKKVFKSKIYHLIFKLDFYLGIVAFMFFFIHTLYIKLFSILLSR